MTADRLLPLIVAVPLGVSFFLPLIGLLHERLAALVTVGTTAVMILLAWGMIGADRVVYSVGGWHPPFGICLVGDGLSTFFHLMIAVIAFLVAIYSIAYMKRFTATTRFYTLFMLMVSGMNGVVASGDLFNIYVFLEIAAFSSYSLVAFGIGREELEASFKYLVLGGMGSSFILFGTALMYSVTGTLNLADIASVLDKSNPGAIIGFIAALLLMGYSVKAALVPFHAWLPDAHPSAPAPISAMLSGLLIKTLGIYLIARIFFTIIDIGQALSPILITLGVLSMVIGALIAIGQNDFKRMLAYSSISQVGYIVFAFGLGNVLGLIGGLFHLLNHAFFKTLLFLCSGAVEYATGTRDLNRLGGLWKKMPVTSSTCTIASMSISGIPPLGGFFSKLIIALAAVQAAEYMGPVAYFLAGITVFVSFLTIVYFIKLQKLAFFGELPSALERVREVPAVMWSVMIVLAAACILFGLVCPWFIGNLVNPAAEALLDKGDYIKQVLETIR
ncbi:MAG: monovalent cation/H+ antiporter subunit D family protein [Candidatus Latescibacteria bacterium]|nr:monovalent cation/H+ antiporter subunit D family protein [Candidatus Latescibacterota bacterium]